jgi:hypothetical protein
VKASGSFVAVEGEYYSRRKVDVSRMVAVNQKAVETVH